MFTNSYASPSIKIQNYIKKNQKQTKNNKPQPINNKQTNKNTKHGRIFLYLASAYKNVVSGKADNIICKFK